MGPHSCACSTWGTRRRCQFQILLGFRSKAKRMVMKLLRNGDVLFTHSNISLVRREFGYRPKLMI
ncbi:putative UDP-glucuronate 4-epimerase [Helianthus anomalus]